jgi:hypothetical protein
MMHISLWQQFTSNHSAAFDLIGTFKTAEDAEQAAVEVRTILRRVREWYGKQYDEDERVELREAEDLLPLTPEEEAIRKQYDLKKWYA